MKFIYGEVKRLCPTCCKELDVCLFVGWPNCMICRTLYSIVDETSNPKRFVRKRQTSRNLTRRSRAKKEVRSKPPANMSGGAVSEYSRYPQRV